MKYVCNCTCGKVIVSSRPVKQCRECYLKTPFPRLNITLEDVAEYGRMGATAKDTAACLSVSTAQMYRVIKRHNLSHLFPIQGGKARWIAERGYAA